MKKMKMEENYTLWEIDFEAPDSEWDWLAIVDKPAIASKGLYFSEEEAESYFNFSYDDDEMRIFGPIMIPDIYMWRKELNGYVKFTKEGIKKSLEKFTKTGNNRRINFNHTNQVVDGHIEEIWKVDRPTGDKSFTSYGKEYPQGSLVGVIKIDDREVWQKVKEDGFYGFSIQGPMKPKLVRFNEEFKEDVLDINLLTDEEIMELAKFVSKS